MAQLGNGEVLVDRPRNESRNGDSGRRARSPKSAYLLVGGSSDTYSVTVNFATGHFCKKDGGANCHGNMNGKARTYGHIGKRDTRNPVAWCKHVKAALANTEALAEAQEITANAFGQPKAIESKPEPVAAVPAKRVGKARERLAEIEAEAAALRVEVEVGDKVSALVSDYGHAAVLAAIEKAAA